MKFDTVIIGGGLSGLTAGIELSKQGQKCAVVSTGQSALHFMSGSFDLLGEFNGEPVSEPFKCIPQLGSEHPYSTLGYDFIKQATSRVQPLFEEMGITLNGVAGTNHYRLTAMGDFKTTWLSMEDFMTFTDNESFPWASASVQNITGFLDFNTSFITEGLTSRGVRCENSTFSVAELDNLRKSPSEMRSSNIARHLENDSVIRKIATIINVNSNNCEVIILPAVFGIFSNAALNTLRTLVIKPICLIGALPPSVPGVRMQIMMRKYFTQLGGTYMLGDTVTSGHLEGDKLDYICTVNHKDMRISADNFIIATGSFFSRGLVATPERIIEPILGLDINTTSPRSEWYSKDIYAPQPYMSYGLKYNSCLQAMKEGKALTNVYVAGAVMGGCNSLKESSGAGVALMSALKVADIISEK